MNNNSLFVEFAADIHRTVLYVEYLMPLMPLILCLLQENLIMPLKLFH